nr:MAG TPA: protein of unknown function DUF29 [Caudoviricetes sp.]
MDKATEIIYNEALLKFKTISERLVEIADLMQRGEIIVAKEELDRLYIESVHSNSNKCGSKLARMMEHILKLAYCDDYNEIVRNGRIWKNDAIKQRDSVIDITRWRMNRQETSIINNIIEDLGTWYERALKYYNTAMKDNHSLMLYEERIPLICIWTLEDLLDKEIVDLVEMLPKQTGYYPKYVKELLSEREKKLTAENILGTSDDI